MQAVDLALNDVVLNEQEKAVLRDMLDSTKPSSEMYFMKVDEKEPTKAVAKTQNILKSHGY